MRHKVYETDAEVLAYDEGFDDGYANAEEYLHTEDEVEKANDEAYQRGFDEAYELRELEDRNREFVRLMTSLIGKSGVYWEEVVKKACEGNAASQYAIAKLIGEKEHAE
jgi:hypothetical protein